MPSRASLASAPRPSSALLRALREKKARVALLFSGQGTEWLSDLAHLHAHFPRARVFAERLAPELNALFLDLPEAERALFDAKLDFLTWAQSPQSAPENRQGAALTAVGTLLCQLMQAEALIEMGLRDLVDGDGVVAHLGHSQGAVGAACLSSMGGLEAEVDRAMAALPWIRFALHMGIFMERAAPSAPHPKLMAQAFEDGVGIPTPMVAVAGLTRLELEGLLQKANASPIGGVSLAAINGPESFTLAGNPEALEGLRSRLFARAQDLIEKKRAGKHAGRVMHPEWTYLPVSAPFHSSSLRDAHKDLMDRMASTRSLWPTLQLRRPVVAFQGGDIFEDQGLFEHLARGIMVEGMDWAAMIHTALERGATHFIDLGPTDGASRLAAQVLVGKGLPIVAASTTTGRDELVHETQIPQPRQRPYSSWAPRWIDHPQKRAQVENAFTRATGTPPVILPGMTPTTVESPIVVAASNAGYWSELAGGGQVTEAILRTRMEEIAEGLQEGRGIIFNALYLDPYLWNLHFAREGLVFRLKEEGFPILGVTISAGIPPKEEALALLERLHQCGITQNALKPGTSAQIEEVLAIADEWDHSLFMHLEGGRAGGHHSWEDLDDLLLRHYRHIRRRENIILCVGGGIATEAQATAYLTGSWSRALGHTEMPVDAIFIGTRLMATREAMTSPQVKELLVNTPGSGDAWPLDGTFKGGMTSGRSQLDAPIYYLDNEAARTARLIDEVAGNGEAIAARKEELIDALAKTAKPYFGDVEQMTMAACLRRFVELSATGKKGPYEDGIWPDRSIRSRFEELFTRFQERLCPQEEENLLATGATSDDPQGAIRLLTKRHPHAEKARLHPEDVDFFRQVCRRPGKPVAFVPFIDVDLRRWFKSDSLHQAHDPRLPGHTVLTIPGPRGLAGIKKANEGVADVLDLFVDHLASALKAEGISRPQAPLGDSGGNLVKSLSRLGTGPLSRLLFEDNAFFESDGKVQAFTNPLHQIFGGTHRPRVDHQCDSQGRLLALTFLEEDGNPAARLFVDEDGVHARLILDHPRGAKELDLHLHWRGGEGESFLHWDRAAFLGAQRQAFAALLDLENKESVPPFSWAQEEISIGKNHVSDFKLATFDDVSGENPTFAFVLGWPAIFRALSGAPGDLFTLVHASNEQELNPAWPPLPGEKVEVRARICALEDEPQGRRIHTVAELFVERKDGPALLATVTSEFLVRDRVALRLGTRRREGRVDAILDVSQKADADFLLNQNFVQVEKGGAESPDASSDGLLGHWTLKADFVEEGKSGKETHCRATGSLGLPDGSQRAIVLDESHRGKNPLQALEALLGPSSKQTVSKKNTPVSIGEKRSRAPRELGAYAAASGDRNPLHLSPAIARWAGFDQCIVHGMWTASWALHRVARLAGNNDLSSLEQGRTRCEFLAPLRPGAPIRVKVQRKGNTDGGQDVEAWVYDEIHDTPVVKVVAAVKPKKGAYLFVGQGAQVPGMGMEAYARSKAAKAVWDEADAITQHRFGFSLLQVVRQNPKSLRLFGKEVFHPEGVLYLTQFTQVALAVLAVARVAEMKEQGVLQEDAPFAGHSLGEYSALAALSGVMPLSGVVEIVYQRGLTMDLLVERDAQGRSPYGMGVIRPHIAGLGAEAALLLVKAVAEKTGQFLQVVNHNVEGRQYSVTGHHDALAALQQKLKKAYVPIPGIDVPFHSTLLRDGVAAFREKLHRALPERIDANRLVGRYLPNLTGTFFELSSRFFEEVEEACASPRVKSWEQALEAGADLDLLAREVLIEVLAYQFASPVRWIDTQAQLFFGTEGIERVVEVGPAHAPTLCGMAHSTLRTRGATHIEVLHAERDRADLAGPRDLENDPDRTPTAVEKPATEVVETKTTEKGGDAAQNATGTKATVARPASQGAGNTPLADDGDTIAMGLFSLVALLSKKKVDAIGAQEKIDELVGGNSARRNQILADLAAEFGAQGMDGAHEIPLSDLIEKIRERAPGYDGVGPFLKSHVDKELQRLFAGWGADRKKIEVHLEKTFGLPSSHRVGVMHQIFRAGRGMTTATAKETPPFADESSAWAWVEHQALAYGQHIGVPVARIDVAPQAVAVDGGALEDLESRVFGALHSGASALAEAFGVQVRDGKTVILPARPAGDGTSNQRDVDPRDQLDDAAAFLAPRFAPEKEVIFDSAWAWGRRDLVEIFDGIERGLDLAESRGDHTEQSLSRRLDGAGRRMAHTLAGQCQNAEARAFFLEMSGAPKPELEHASTVALVTGAGKGSIALEVVANLLAQGARVAVTTSSYGKARLDLFKTVYQANAVPGAELMVLPFNQASFADVDDLCAHLEGRGDWVPNLLLPFGAMPETADLLDVGPRSEVTLRVLLLSVERLIARMAQMARPPEERCHVIMPLSPNHGSFGGDGAYGESKAALEALMNRWHSEERSWGRHISLVGAKIGWVRGTGLMHQNDSVAEALAEEGLKTFSAREMAQHLADACSAENKKAAAQGPLWLDVTGGLGAVGGLADKLRTFHEKAAKKARDIQRKNALEAEYRAMLGDEDAGQKGPGESLHPRARPEIEAPIPTPTELADLPPLDHLDPHEVVVVCGFGEVGPLGNSRTRWELEKGKTLSTEAVQELAFVMGFLHMGKDGSGLVDAETGEKVEDHELHARYEEKILDDVGVRVVKSENTGFDPEGLLQLVDVHLDRDFSFPVSDVAVAEAILASDPSHTEINRHGDGEIWVTRRRGAVLHVPSARAVNRHVQGQLPTGWNAARLGIPETLVDQVDPVTLYCLVSTAEAFLQAGLEPEEITRFLHPGRVGITLGTGIGGMKKLHRLHRDFHSGSNRQNDTLQETLINVIGGYVVQSYLGSYGPMSFPVGACATAGVSVADGVDKILQGRADFVVAGGADDLSEAGLIGFGDMGATADTRTLEAAGIESRHMSRPSDSRRRGFVESQGAGVLLLARASVALEMGLPVHGVVAFAETSGDGIQQSVPAPGQGALAMVCGEGSGPDAGGFAQRRNRIRELREKHPDLKTLFGQDEADRIVLGQQRALAHDPKSVQPGLSPLAAALSVFGLGADDIAVVSKHDSSTLANDENEARLHERMAKALGRKEGLPMAVISQKALTGHPKGAAAAWQLNGLMQVMAEGILPANASLDNVSEELRAFEWLINTDRPRKVARRSLRAGLVSTLGFGHISALVALVHPFFFWRMLSDEERQIYQGKMERRLMSATTRLQEVLAQKRPLVRVRSEKPFADAAEEAQMLLDPGARP
jgi:fatty acid synthase